MGAWFSGRVRTLPAVVAGLVAGLVAVVLTGVLAPGVALAHNSLVSSSPKNGAKLASPPASVRLTFLARLDPKTMKVTVTGPDGISVAAAAPAYSGKTVTVRLRAVAAGAYTVAYQLISADGDPVKGRVAFTVATGSAPTSTPTPSPTPSTSDVPAPTSAAAPPPASAPSLAPASGESGGNAWGWLLVGGMALVAALLAGTLIYRRQQRP